MAYLDWLEKELAPAVKRQQIGQPVALRALFQLTEDHGQLLRALAQAVEMAGRWFGHPLTRVYAQGGAPAGYITALAEYEGGQTALLTSESRRGSKSLAMVLLIGNHGTLRFDDAPGTAVIADADSPVRRLLEASLESGNPVARDAA